MHKQRLLEALRKIRDEGPVGRAAGICSSVYVLTQHDRVVENAMDDLAMSWPGVYPSLAFPVDGSDNYYADRAKGALWANPRRIELLNWMIVQLEETLNVA